MREILTPAYVAPAFNPSTIPEEQYPKPIEVVALWDTGATASCVSRYVIERLGLKPTGMSKVMNAHGGVRVLPTYQSSISYCRAMSRRRMSP